MPDLVMQVRHYALITPRNIFIEAAKRANIPDFPYIGSLWYKTWLVEDSLPGWVREYCLYILSIKEEVRDHG